MKGILAACALAFVALASPAPASAARSACEQAAAQCTTPIAVPGSEGRVTVYRSYPLDAPDPLVARALIVIHGLGRDADIYYRSALAAAYLASALADTIVIVPRFASRERSCKDDLAPGELSWHCQPRSDTWRTGGTAVEGKATSFDVVDELLRKLDDKRVFPNLKSIVVAGHSAGGQFVQRYAMSNEVHDGLAVKPVYFVANPSSYAYPDELRPTASAFPRTVAALPPGYQAPLPENPPPPFAAISDVRCTGYDDWPYGFKNRNGYAAKIGDDLLRKRMAERPTTYLLGELDILPLYGFDSSCGAMAQGGTRLARGLAYARHVNEKYGAKHAAVVVPACGHSARCMLGSETSLPLLFPKQ